MAMGAELGWFVITLLASFFPRFDACMPLMYLSQSAAATLITALWQGLAIAACLQLCLRVAPRISAALRFAILAAGFLAIAALPFVPAVSALFHRNAQAVASAAATGSPWLVLDARWSLALTALWACASLWRLGDLAVHSVRLRRLWQHAVPVPSNLVFPALPGRRPVEICSTSELEKPSVIGFLAPRILIPGWLLERMTPEELEQVVLHETEHLRRGDDWSNLLQKFALAFFPLNPALLWLERRLCLEREMACDEGVVRQTQAPRAYAACLTSLAERGLDRRTQALSLGVWQRRPELARRVHSILLRKPVLKPAAARGLLAVLGCSLVAGSVELARCPQLIGFASVPAIQAHSATREDLAQSKADSIGDRVMRPELQTVAARSQNIARPHMTELKAVLPMRADGLWTEIPGRLVRYNSARNDSGRFNQEHSAAGSSGAPLMATSRAIQPSVSAPHEQLLKADFPDQTAKASVDEVKPGQMAQDSGAQGWIVLTTWEQTDAPVETAQTIGDATGKSSALTAKASDDANNLVSQTAHARSQVTVTQLVFRVTQAPPAQGDHADASRALRPTIVPVRGGWLIFRL